MLIRQPTFKEQITIRLLILLGVAGMIFFLYQLFDSSNIAYAPLYWLLMINIALTCVKIAYEWYHYFNIKVPEIPIAEKQYTVDIFTTFCAGEPYEMIEETLRAIQAIAYPHEAYLCDEANDTYLKQLCQELDVHHVTRTIKINAKAGNINNALQQSDGELCVVLDPDHVPSPDFLDPIVANFNNPEIGFVQIVQAYKNYDESLIAKGAAQQTFQFYGPIMMTMNTYGTVQAIGANCTFRRTALQSIGGHAAGLAEDMNTAMHLHAKGWKSLYVPVVLARGLVPSTLSAYYLQQLKWSRGVFELLVTTYPQYFKQFTWRQKLHYGLTPFFYLSGFIFLINFLIPVLSLFLGLKPMKIDLGSFAIIALPLLGFTILIRNYVQKWVMEEKEQGFHVVGGLLLIGTWWIFILGFVYTIIRKKIPYIPTPKDAREEGNWLLNTPNIAVIVVSVASILYGLYTDWNPYNIIMAGFAALNCFFMAFNILASKQNSFKRIPEYHKVIDHAIYQLISAKKEFWKLRRRLYHTVRETTLALAIIILGFTMYALKGEYRVESNYKYRIDKKNVFYKGIFAPTKTDGLSSMSLVKDYQKQYNTHFDIISFYIPWGEKEQCYLPDSLINSTYNNGSLPLITWEPWTNLFNKASNNQKVFKDITDHVYDDYIDTFAHQIKNLNRPVYLRFAHEADNPAYPWSATGGNTPQEYIAAWKYLHQYFINCGATNVIWVWNPWKPEALAKYFPGKYYVDWIGLTLLNYGSYNKDNKWYSMEELYNPFREDPIFQSGLPVMLAETGSLATEHMQEEWLQEAWAARIKFPEIKAIIFFNSGLDMNVPEGKSSSMLNWKIQNPKFMASLLKEDKPERNYPIPQLKLGNNQKAASVKKSYRKLDYDAIRGVNYADDLFWFQQYQTYTKKEIVKEFKEMKAVGINTISYGGSGLQDYNVLLAAKDCDLSINYVLNIPWGIDFIEDKEQLENISDDLLMVVKQQKHYSHIKMRSIGSSIYQGLQYYYDKPELLYQQQAYLAWLKSLVIKIKAIDKQRPVSVGVEANEDLLETVQQLKYHIPELDSYGLIVSDKSLGIAKIKDLQVSYYFSKIAPEVYFGGNFSNKGIILSAWQDLLSSRKVYFDGLKDHYGKHKPQFYQLAKRWKGENTVSSIPKIRILKPAVTVIPDEKLIYHALINKNGKWIIANKTHEREYTFTWQLVKLDEYGTGVFMKEIANGVALNLAIPKDPKTYHLYLAVSKADEVVTTKTTLHTPLKGLITGVKL